jgi:DNA repair exonuclease SbcCD nuclease subunit
MKRNKPPVKQRIADAILTADTHIRPNTPTCRTDDFFAAQSRKIDFILNLAEDNENCPVLIAGDLGNAPLNLGWPTWLLEWTIRKFEGHHIIMIPGQHDLPNHKLNLWDQSGIGVLEAAGAIRVLGVPKKEQKENYLIPYELEKATVFPFPYGVEIKSPTQEILEYNIHSYRQPWIAMVHQMVIEENPLWIGQQASTGLQLLKQFPEYALILSGDNHIPFTVEYEGRILVNPGSMMRTTAAQIDHTPRVYLWYRELNTVVPVFLPIEQNVVSRNHIEIMEQRDQRFSAYVNHVRADMEIELSFPHNVEEYFKKNRTQGRVKEKVWGAIQ